MQYNRIQHDTVLHDTMLCKVDRKIEAGAYSIFAASLIMLISLISLQHVMFYDMGATSTTATIVGT